MIVMRHVAYARLVQPVARLDREMMGRVMHEHVSGVTKQHAAGESTGRDVLQDSYREIADGDDETPRCERGHADEFLRRLVMRIMQHRKQRRAMVGEATDGIFDQRPSRETNQQGNAEVRRRPQPSGGGRGSERSSAPSRWATILRLDIIPAGSHEETGMKIVIIGATGTIGGAVATALGGNHEIVAVSRSAGEHHADITDKASLEKAFEAIGKVDAIVSVAGGAVFKPLAALTDADFEKCLHDKLMGQVNVVRVGSRHVRPGGSITITSGVLAQEPMPGAAAISLVNAGLEGFGRAAALELASEKIRVNVVSPPWVTETLVALKMEPANGLPAAEVARAYVQSVEGDTTGQTIDARKVLS
jgi:NAD(P)-dependent dehydrogenase (short-subunit alcohol dehydrogenase family)